MTQSFTAVARRNGRVWWVQCDQYPSAFSSVARLADAAAHQREAVAFVSGLPADEIEVAVRPELPSELATAVEDARTAAEAADAARRDAAARSRAAVARLRSAGLSGADVAAVLGVSPQRVSQLSRVS